VAYFPIEMLLSFYELLNVIASHYADVCAQTHTYTHTHTFIYSYLLAINTVKGQ